MELLRPVRTQLYPQLSAVYAEAGRPETQRSLATDILFDYAADNPAVLANFLLDADDQQFARFYPLFNEHGGRGLSVLTGEIDKKLPAAAKDQEKETLAKR
jgi:hypothetical protein